MSKQEKILSALSDVRDEFVEESDLSAVIPVQRLRKTRIIAVGIAAALCCSLVVAGAALMLNLVRFKDGVSEGGTIQLNWETKRVKKELEQEIAYVPTWDERTITQRYPAVEYQGTWYSASSGVSPVEGAAVPADLLGEKLGEALLVGQDIYTDSKYEITGDLYSIEGINPDCALAVQFNGETVAYAYLDHYYQPETLGDLLDALSLERNLTFGSVYYDFIRDGDYVDVEFPEVPAEKIWELLSDRSAATLSAGEYESVFYHEMMSVSVNIPLLGIQNMSLSVTDNGYITTNIMGQGHAFFIGTEKIEAFVTYVLTQCKGYELVYITDEADAVPEAGQGGGSVETVTAQSAAAFPGNAGSPVVSD